MAGLALLLVALRSAVRAFVLPRNTSDPIVRWVFRGTRAVFRLALLRRRTFAARDSLLAFYAPVGLLALLPVWLTIVTAGFTLMLWAAGVQPLSRALYMSGSSLLTLGFVPATGLAQMLLSFSEATVGLIIVALLIAYLPTIYGAFSRRETAVSLLEVRAGSPPSAVQMIERYHRIHGLERLTELWVEWERWFADLEETHTSLAALTFFRSPVPERHWVIGAGAVLDGAALVLAAVDVPRTAEAALCLRAGFLSLRRIAGFFRIEYDADPSPSDPIAIRRDEFDAVFERLAADGVPMVADRDQAWRDFAGWRVNYDTVLVALAHLTMAPQAMWSSDRPAAGVRPWFLDGAGGQG